jgi:dihydropteroate synthase
MIGKCLPSKWGYKTLVMGVINMTPDSFSGDGLDYDAEKALALARRLLNEGADIIDIGGESTRPGAAGISATEEIRRVVPVLEKLSREIGIPLSIDTCKAEVASRAIEAGASLINDIAGLKKDPAIAEVAAKYGAGLVITSNQRDNPREGHIIAEVTRDLRERITLALRAGVSLENIIIDTGIGFGKSLEQNLEILRRLNELKVLDRPILIGTSRKSFIGQVLNLPVTERLEGTLASIALAIAGGADIVRVHDVKEAVRVCRISDAVVRGRYDGQL